jgi:3-dehydroquinate synthase
MVAGAVILTKVLIENVLGIDVEPWARAWVTDAGPAGAMTVVTLLAVDMFLPIPSSLVMILSGAAFGVWWGALLAFAGSIGGEWIGFELARRYGTRVATRMVGDEAEVQRLNRILARHGAAAVAVTRALPVVMETMSVVAGLSTMSRGSFLAASTIGTAPIVVIYAYAGAMSRETGSLVPAVVILVAVAAGGWIWYRARVQ